MNKIKLAFFGTSDRSIPILNALKENFDLLLCITKRDTKVGRHQEIRETEVKKWSKANFVQVTTIASLKGIELEQIIDQIKSLEIEYAIVADFSFMIPLELIEYFGGKLINIHFSLLPLYRGASPVQKAILDGQTTTGITYQLIDRKMDAGKIIHQIGYKLAGNETSGQLYATLFELAAENVAEVINKYHDGTYKARQQDEAVASYTSSLSHPNSTFIYKEDAQVNWKNSISQIYNAIRAFNPWPIAFTKCGEIEKNKKLWQQKLQLRKGIDRKLNLKIHEAKMTSDGLLELITIQLEGKNKMDWKSFENGYIKQL